MPLLVAGIALSLFGAAPANAQAPKAGGSLIYSVKGPDLYHAYCAVCHGTNATGDGPMAASLKSKTPDLTLLARRNHGDFPTARVHRILEGQEPLSLHGTQEMPIWGPIFHQIEYDQDLGAVRMANLIQYLQSIQRK